MAAPTFVLICGKRFEGKDYVGAAIHARTGWTRDSFAHAVKEACARKHQLDLDMLLTNQLYKDAHRALLIAHGTEKRAKDVMYWAKKLYEKHCQPGDITVVTDLRFRSERDYLVQQGAIVITVRVAASDAVRMTRGWNPDPTIDEDPSEREFDGEQCDITVNNNEPRMPDVDDVLTLVAARRKVPEQALSLATLACVNAIVCYVMENDVRMSRLEATTNGAAVDVAITVGDPSQAQQIAYVLRRCAHQVTLDTHTLCVRFEHEDEGAAGRLRAALAFEAHAKNDD